MTKPIQTAGTVPVIDNTVKYVDENGLIGMDISTQLTIPNGSRSANIGHHRLRGRQRLGAKVDLPDFFVRTTRTRVNLRDGQTVAINGLIDKDMTKTITQVPFFASLPLFGNLFKGHNDINARRGSHRSGHAPHRPHARSGQRPLSQAEVYPEMQDMGREYGDIPIIKPVRYDAQAVDLRPESPKDMKDDKNDDSAPAAAA